MTALPGTTGAELPGDRDAIVASFEHLPAAVFVYEGPDHVFAAVNAAAREILMTRDGYDDDVTVIAAERTGPVPGDLHLELSAVPEELAGLRRHLAAWLDAIGADRDDVLCIQLAVGEAAANSVEHAYPGAPGPLVVEGYHDAAGRACRPLRAVTIAAVTAAARRVGAVTARRKRAGAASGRAARKRRARCATRWPEWRRWGRRTGSAAWAPSSVSGRTPTTRRTCRVG